MKSPRWVSLLRMILGRNQNTSAGRDKGSHSREQRNELGRLREDGESVKLDLG